MNKDTNRVKNFKQFINESLEQNNVVIEISGDDSKRNRKSEFHINYQTTIDGKLIEIEGTLIPFHTGRSEENQFEPSYFTDDESEKYYDDNWEKIEDEILNKFNEGNF